MVELWCGAGQTVVVGVAPETYLRLMAERLAQAGPQGGLQVIAASIQAAAYAFAMLGLLTAEGAEAAMAQASRARELRGIGGLEPGGMAGTSLRLLEGAG